MIFYQTLVAIVIGVNAVHADSYSGNSEMQVMKAVAYGISLYARKNSGDLPTSWNEIRTVYPFDKVCDEYLGRPASFIEDRYQFVEQKLTYGTGEGMDVLLIRTLPFRMKRSNQLKRILVTRSSSGRIRSVYPDEQAVQRMLSKAGITIESTQGLPTEEPEVEYKPSVAVIPPTRIEQNVTPASAKTERPAPTAAKVTETEPTKSVSMMLIVGAVALVTVSAFLVLRRKKDGS